MSSARQTLLRAAIGLTGAAAAVAAATARAPRPRGDEVDATEFSTARAEHHLNAVATQPRPSGSPRADTIHDYLCKELVDLGFEVSTQVTTSVTNAGHAPYGLRYQGAGRVRNILAVLPGTDGTQAVLAMTHYDSVAQGPGAGDAGMPLAALLECARALAARPQSRNDIALLITDGEEAGLLGAIGFFAEHPAVTRVGAVLNFEARGTGGPVLMFEAGYGNRQLIDELARCGVPVHASSLFDAVYRRLPNATDFSISKQRGLPGLNFANVQGFARYHGPGDSLQHAERATMAHHGRLALAMLSRLGGTDLTALHADDAVFFTVGNGRLVRYSYPVATGAGIAAAALAALAVRRWSARTDAPWVSIGRSTAALLGRLALGATAATAYTQAIGRRNPEFRRSGDVYDSADVYLGVVGLALAVELLVGRGDRVDGEGRLAATTVPMALAAAWTGAKAPAGSYLPTWSALGAGLALLASGRGGATAGVLPAVGIWLPMSRLLHDGLTPRLSAATALAVQLAGNLAAPALSTLPPRWRRGAGIAAVAASAVVLARRTLGRRGDPNRPVPAPLMYVLDADAGRARWVASTENAWTRAILGQRPATGELPDFFPGWRRSFRHAPAAVLALPAPEVEVRSVRPVGRLRRIELRVRSPRGARQMSLSTLDGSVVDWAVEGRRVAQLSDAGEPWELWLHAVPPDGFQVELDVRGDGPLRLRVADRSDGFAPEVRALMFPEGDEPAGYGPAAALDAETWADATFVSRWLTIDHPGPGEGVK